jgi:hypothetical protein
MKTLPVLASAALLLAGLLWSASPLAALREPAHAGRFYPGDPAKLEAAVHAFLEDAVPATGERPVGLAAPHAGYVFSGQIAADAYRQAAGFDYDVIVVLGVNHTVEPFDGVSVFGGDGYRTPLGLSRADRDLARALHRADPAFAYRPEAHAREHSEEVQIPFLQVLFPKVPVLTTVVGSAEPALCRRFGEALALALAGRKPLLVASTDLSHYPGWGDAVEADRRTLEALASLDAETLRASLAREERRGRPGLQTCACGEGPLLALLAATKALGARRARVLSYANSGDTVFGEADRVVGYGAVALTAGPGPSDTSSLNPPEAGGQGPLSAEDRETLLRLARRTLDRLYATDTVPLPRPASPALRAERGAFVTLKKGGDLRGCIGHMAQDAPLALTVSRMAVQAALHDTRFEPVRAEELPLLEIEISALTPFAKVSGPGALSVGRDGVLIRKGGRSAVFLPQVAPEQGWDREELLTHLCRKAGLNDDAWRGPCDLYTFQAEVFAEKKREGR